jgi:hypothetical protein
MPFCRLIWKLSGFKIVKCRKINRTPTIKRRIRVASPMPITYYNPLSLTRLYNLSLIGSTTITNCVQEMLLRKFHLTSSFVFWCLRTVKILVFIKITDQAVWPVSCIQKINRFESWTELDWLWVFVCSLISFRITTIHIPIFTCQYSTLCFTGRWVTAAVKTSSWNSRITYAKLKLSVQV